MFHQVTLLHTLLFLFFYCENSHLVGAISGLWLLSHMTVIIVSTPYEMTSHAELFVDLGWCKTKDIHPLTGLGPQS